MSSNKKIIAEAFSHAAPLYDHVAVLQQEIGARLFERLTEVEFDTPTRVLDVGAGTGHWSRRLAKHYADADVMGCDLAFGMMTFAAQYQQAKQHYPQFICGDVEALPFLESQVDLIFSNCVLQWCEALPKALFEMCRVLRPGGWLFFSTFGPETLQELRDSWATLDDKKHVDEFIDIQTLGDSMMRAGFEEITLDRDVFTLTYPNVLDLVKELKILGSRNVAGDRDRGLMGKQKWQQLLQAYEVYRDEKTQQLPATYEVIYACARKRHFHEG